MQNYCPKNYALTLTPNSQSGPGSATLETLIGLGLASRSELLGCCLTALQQVKVVSAWMLQKELGEGSLRSYNCSILGGMVQTFGKFFQY